MRETGPFVHRGMAETETAAGGDGTSGAMATIDSPRPERLCESEKELQVPLPPPHHTSPLRH